MPVRLAPEKRRFFLVAFAPSACWLTFGRRKGPPAPLGAIDVFMRAATSLLAFLAAASGMPPVEPSFFGRSLADKTWRWPLSAPCPPASYLAFRCLNQLALMWSRAHAVGEYAAILGLAATLGAMFLVRCH